MLYSFKDQYPAELPFRIVLSNNLTRTDPSTFTEEEIADAGYTLVPDPPSITENQVLEWVGSWSIRDKTQEELSIEMQLKIKEYDKALTLHLDQTAQSKQYDNRITCAVRAGYSGPFQAEGIAFATWMDNCNYQAYQILAQVNAGSIPAPTVEEFIASLPVMVWPE